MEEPAQPRGSKLGHNRRYARYIERWLAGLETGGHTKNRFVVSRHVRRWLRLTRGERCEQCGWCERNLVTDSVPVQIDHVDGNPENHRPENLRLLCPNCHSLTPTYMNLNRGHGRKGRYKKNLDDETVKLPYPPAKWSVRETG